MWTEPPGTTPLVKSLIGAENFDKDLSSLDRAERFTHFIIAHPGRVSGKVLVAILSTSDDSSIGVGSSRGEILRSLVKGGQSSVALVLTSTQLHDCQAALYNAGDDFVELVMNFVGAEDDQIGASKGNPRHP